MKKRLLSIAIALLVIAGLVYGGVLAWGAWSKKRLEADMVHGGYVIYLRHAERNSGPKEPFNAQSQIADFANCEGQRNLTDQGRADAKKVGQTFQTLGIPIGTVIALPLCRTRDTAMLAFGHATLEPKLYDPQFVATLLALPPADGTNTVLVDTEDQAWHLIGVKLKPAEAAVFKPKAGGGYDYVGMLNRKDLYR